MDLAGSRFLISGSGPQHLSPLSSPVSSFLRPHSHSASTSFPIIAIAIIGILATAFLLVSYYIFVIKCCLNWHRIDLLRRFSPSRRRDEPPMTYWPAGTEPRGLDEAVIRLIPVIHYKAEENRESGERSFSECSVCLNEFREKEKLRIIPNCSHVFHIDCIDVWLQNNANCPLCRTSISLSTRFQVDQILNPRPSCQDRRPYGENLNGGDEDFVVIELSTIGHDRDQNSNGTQEGENPAREVTPSPRKIMEQKKKAWKFQKVTSMGDECIDTRGSKDEQFSVQPMRRSFSMDSSGDRQLYMAVQEALKKQNREQASEVSSSSINEGCSSSGGGRVKRSFFSFGHGSSRSRSSVQPVHVDH